MAEKKFFGLDKKRYETEQIVQELDISYRFIMWNLIDVLREHMELDSLQIFEFVCENKSGVINNKTFKQRLIHRQEEPAYAKEYDFPSHTCINCRVYVRDNGEYCCMMFDDEA